MLRVVDVDYIKDYELLVTFSDGSKKKVDLNHTLQEKCLGNCWIRISHPIRIDAHNYRMGKWGRFSSGVFA